jgi:anti-sigma-K factor RskA
VITTPSHTARPELAKDLYQRMLANKSGTVATQPMRAVSPRRRLIRYALPLAAALALIIAAVILVASRGDDEPPMPHAERLYEDIMEQTGAHEMPVMPGENQSATGTMAVSSDGMQAVIRVEQLPELPDDQAFQLWVVTMDGTVSSGGVFRASEAEMYIEVPLQMAIENYQQFGVSIEPVAGSPYPDRPTGPRVFMIPVQT